MSNHVSSFALQASRLTRHISRILTLACLAALSIALPAPALAQDDISFTALVDRNAISTDDVLTLELTLAGTFNSPGQPQFPPLEGFAVLGTSQSSQFSIVNGKTSSRVVFTYRLQPTSIGTLTIPPVLIQMGGKDYETDAITVDVTQGAAPQPQQPSSDAPPDASSPGELTGQDLYVEANVDNLDPVVGQQIIYTFRLFQAVQFFNQPRLSWPEFTGFLGQDLSPNTQYQQAVAGRQYLVTEVRRALFPATPGASTFTRAILTIPGDLFSPEVVLATEPVTVNVQPLPGGAPEGFAGAVGRFEIDAWVEPGETRVNEPVTLFVRVTGPGNVGMVSDPSAEAEVTLPGWRVYEPEITTEVSQEGDTIRGEKRFERLLVPKAEGELTIPPFRLVYFDPTAGEYRSIETTPLVVGVASGEEQAPGLVVLGDGKQDVVVLASDIRHIKPAPPGLASEQTPLLVRPLYWVGWALPLLVVAGTWLWNRRCHTLAQDAAYARSQRARRLGRRRLVEARRLIEANPSGADASGLACAAVARALTAYVGDKFNLPAAGLTRDGITQTLEACPIPEDLIDRVLACLDWADSGRFAPVAAGRGAHELVEAAERVMTGLEERIGRQGAGE